MSLTAREKERLLVNIAADLAKRRLKRGIRLNYAQTVAFIAMELQERANDGMSPEELKRHGEGLLRKEQVLGGIPELVQVLDIQVEANAPFPAGEQTITLHNPIR